jgi:hypothetical protein
MFIRIPNPDYFPSHTQIKHKKELAINFTKLKILFFPTGTENDLSQLTQKLGIFNPKYCFLAPVTKLSKVWVGSGIRKKHIQDPGVKKPVLRIRIHIRMNPHDFGLLDPHPESVFQMRIPDAKNEVKSRWTLPLKISYTITC